MNKLPQRSIFHRWGQTTPEVDFPPEVIFSQDKAVRAVDRGDHLDRPPLQDDRLLGTVPGADTAAEADGLVDDRMFFPGAGSSGHTY